MLRSSNKKQKTGTTKKTSIAKQLKAIPRTEAKDIANDLIASIRPPAVPMAVVLASNEIRRAKEFFTISHSTAAKPGKTFQELVEFVHSIGLEQKQVIDFTEKDWKTPGTKKNPGANRHDLSSKVFRNIIKHKQ